jgi:RNA polymerase sigma factor (TIGR02999 family)
MLDGDVVDFVRLWGAAEEKAAAVVTSRLTILLICEKLSPFEGSRLRRDQIVGEAGVGSAISSLVVAAERGDHSAAEALFAALYSELHRVAKRELARQGPPVSLSATTLLHEAYLDMAARDGPSFPDRARFMGYAARVMRGLVIDHARERHAQKRGGLFELTSLDTQAMENAVDHRELVQISEALDELLKVEPALAEIVDLKFFCGFSFVEIAAMRNISERTVQRNWEKARIYLHRKIRPDLSL